MRTSRVRIRSRPHLRHVSVSTCLPRLGQTCTVVCAAGYDLAGGAGSSGPVGSVPGPTEGENQCQTPAWTSGVGAGVRGTGEFGE